MKNITETLNLALNESLNLDLGELGIKPKDIPATILKQAEDTVREMNNFLSKLPTFDTQDWREIDKCADANKQALEKIMSKFPYWSTEYNSIGFGYRMMMPNASYTKFRPVFNAFTKVMGESPAMSNGNWKVVSEEQWATAFYSMRGSKVKNVAPVGREGELTWRGTKSIIFAKRIIDHYLKDPSIELLVIYTPGYGTDDE